MRTAPEDAVRIRPAGPLDVPAIAVLERDHLGPDAWSRALIGAGVGGQVPTVHYLVATVGAGMSEVVVAHAVVSAMPDLAELQRIAVQTGRRRQGVATRLIRAVADLAAREGGSRLLLEVRDGNAAAQALYAGHGFVEVHRRPRYYADGTTAVVLQLDLHPDPTTAATKPATAPDPAPAVVPDPDPGVPATAAPGVTLES